MLGLQELRAANERAAQQELAHMRADTLRYIRYVVREGGIDALHALFMEAVPPGMAVGLPERKVA